MPTELLDIAPKREPIATEVARQTIVRPAGVSIALFRPLLLSCGLTLLAACGPTGLGEEPVAAAIRLFESGHADKAIVRLNAILEREPGNLGARYVLGVVYLETHDAKTDKVLEQLEGMDGAPDVRALRVRAWFMKREYKKVLEALAAKSGQGTATSPELLALRGHALFRVGHFTDAEATFKQAIALQSDLADAHMGLARLALWESRLQEGKALAERALGLYKKPTFDAWQTKGDIEHALGNTDAAVEAYRKALAIVPKSVPVLINLTWVQIGAQRYDRATESIDLLRKASPGSVVADYVQAVTSFRQGEYAKARDYAAVVARASPGHVESAYLAGAAAFKLEDYATAARFLSAALARAHENLHIRTLLMFAYARSNQIYDGLKVLRSVERYEAGDKNFWAAAGELRLAAGRSAQAVEAFSRSLQSDPRNTELLAFRGISHLSAGNIDAAITDLQASLLGGEASLDAHTKLVLAYLRNKQPEQAAAAIRELTGARQSDPTVVKLRAAVLMAQNDRTGALKLLEQAFAIQTADPTLGVQIARIELDSEGAGTAKARLLDVLKRDAANLDALLDLAALAYRDGDRQERVRWLEEARKNNPKAPKPRVLLAHHYLVANDVRKAIEYAIEAQKLAPDSPEMLLILGQAQMSAANPGNAVATFGHLLALQPDSAEANYQMGLAQHASGSGPAAAQSYERAIALDPTHAGAMFALGRYQIAVPRYTESMRWARKLQESPASRHDGLILEGDTLFAQASFAAASTAYRKAYAERKSKVAAAKSHGALKRAGRAEEGEAILLEWLTEHPEDLATRLYFASALHQRRAYPLAIEQYEFIRQRQPDNALVLGNLAEALYRSGDPRALPLAQEAYKLAPDSADVLETLGLIELGRGRAEPAAELLEKATLIAPDSPEVRYHFALALVKAGNLPRARSELERVVAAKRPFSEESGARSLLTQLEFALARE